MRSTRTSDSPNRESIRLSLCAAKRIALPKQLRRTGYEWIRIKLLALSTFLGKSLDLMRHLVSVVVSCMVLAVGGIARGEGAPVRRALPVQPFPDTSKQQPTVQSPILRRGVADDPSGAAGLRLYPADAPDTIAGSAMMLEARNGAV